MSERDALAHIVIVTRAHCEHCMGTGLVSKTEPAGEAYRVTVSYCECRHVEFASRSPAPEET